MDCSALPKSLMTHRFRSSQNKATCLHGRSKKPARFYRLAACPPMLRWICSSPSNAEDKRIRVHVCNSFPGATIIISIGGHATNFVQVLLHLRALEGMLHCSYKLLFVVAHKSKKNMLSHFVFSNGGRAASPPQHWRACCEAMKACWFV